LTRAKRLNDPNIVGLTKKYGKTPAQVLICWSLQHDLVVIPKSIHEERIGKAKGKPNVKYVVYPNGKVMVYIACSDTPFKLETEANEGLLFSSLVGPMRLLNDLNPKQSILL
jgi:hypothetical protein